MPYHKPSTNVYVENIREVVQVAIKPYRINTKKDKNLTLISMTNGEYICYLWCSKL